MGLPQKVGLAVIALAGFAGSAVAKLSLMLFLSALAVFMFLNF